MSTLELPWSYDSVDAEEEGKEGSSLRGGDGPWDILSWFDLFVLGGGSSGGKLGSEACLVASTSCSCAFCARVCAWVGVGNLREEHWLGARGSILLSVRRMASLS